MQLQTPTAALAAPTHHLWPVAVAHTEQQMMTQRQSQLLPLLQVVCSSAARVTAACGTTLCPGGSMLWWPA